MLGNIHILLGLLGWLVDKVSLDAGNHFSVISRLKIVPYYLLLHRYNCQPFVISIHEASFLLRKKIERNIVGESILKEFCALSAHILYEERTSQPVKWEGISLSLLLLELYDCIPFHVEDTFRDG